MAVTNIARSLRDAELVIKDGTTPTPQSLTLQIDEGDLTWTVRTRTIEIRDRGSLITGHTRKGDDEPISLSFSARWTQLIGKSADGADPLQLYEMLMFTSGANVVSTSSTGEQETLQLEFTLTDPAGAASEKVTFSKVYRETLRLSEGDTFNLIQFSGRSFETQPAIARV